MSNRDTYGASVASAAAAKTATVATAVSAAQTTIDAALTVVGYTTQAGNYATLLAAVKAAAIAKANSLFAAEQTRQATIAVARDTLRNGGDVAAV